jgi:hypothetical protein
MNVFELHVLAPESLSRHYAATAPQKDCLCGAFWGAIALRCGGIETVESEPVDQDLLAVECGVTLDDGDPRESLPPGAVSRLDYRLRLPFAADRARSGTSAASLRSAIARCSGGALAPVPVRGPWSEKSVLALFRTVQRHAPDALLVANWRTGHLWGTRPTPQLLLAYLAGGSVEGPSPEWNVGHFVALPFALVAGTRALVGVLDTYPALGCDGYHLQPAGAVARALAREDEPSEGGILCVARAEDEAALSLALEAEGFLLGDWDNGSDGR